MVQRISAPGFLCRRHVITRVKEHPLQKIDVVYSQPVLSENPDNSSGHLLWTWSRQDMERNFSIFNVQKGIIFKDMLLLIQCIDCCNYTLNNISYCNYLP